MLDWPDGFDIMFYLRTTRFAWNTDGWRAIAEMAGHFECPEWTRLERPLRVLEEHGDVEVRKVEDGPRLFRATK